MDTTDRAITELTELIQPGDMLTLSSGYVFAAVSAPQNVARYRRGHARLVAIRTFVTVAGEQVGCQIPVSLHCVQQVERAGYVIWDIAGERLPVQRTLL